MVSVRYKYYSHEGSLFREHPDTWEMDYWNGEGWSAVLGIEDATIRFDGVVLTPEAAKKLMVKR
jgi:hypothetical protein